MALDSLAIWPVFSGILFIFRSLGIAYNEVVVTLLNSPNSYRSLKKFALFLTTISTTLLLLITATPLSSFWYLKVSALPVSLLTLANTTLWLSLLIPGANALQSWYQGILLNSGETRGIPEAVFLFLFVTIVIYSIGIVQGKYPGIYVGTLGFSIGMACQAAWLRFKSRSAANEFKNSFH